MERRREFFKKIHPEQFSDTRIVKIGQLDRDFFSYFLEKLTSEGREKIFEDFCRKLAEVEICPNLLPQTGPTGGGDSKVDSETYPVSEDITDSWYYGHGEEAASSRWAFAISAMKDWKPKVKSDVNKIVKVNIDLGRNYTKIFFMSNQYISDKKRADTEDELRKKHQIDVRILDKNWILEKVFTGNNKNIAIDCFGLSDSFRDDEQIGPNDLNRKIRFEEIQEALKMPKTLKPAYLLSLAKESIHLARELELSKEKMIGILERAQSFATKYGTNIDLVKVIYEYAWTIHWWYSDNLLYYKKYKEYEELTLNNSNIEQLKDLSTLWINLHSLASERSDFSTIERHTDLLINEHKKYINDSTKPNAALEARASFQTVRILLGHNLDEILIELIDIIKTSGNKLNINFDSINKIINEIPLFRDSQYYDEIFELLIEKMGEKSQEITTARMLNNRGIEFQENQPYKAIQYFSRSLNKLFRKESVNDLISTLLNMAMSFEKMGVLWAARNFYMYVFQLSLNQYFRFGEVNPALIISTNSLKFLELRFGRIMHSLEFNKMENISMSLYPEAINENEEDLYDYILGIQMFNVDFSVLPLLEYLPDYLIKNDLPFSSVALKYELGYYDKDILAQLANDKAAFDDFVNKWYNQPVREQFIGSPWFGFEEQVVLNSKILGCNIKVISSNSTICMEIGATILASIESFLVTGIQNKLFPMSESIVFEIKHSNNDSFELHWEERKDEGSRVHVTCSDYLSDEFINAQEKMQNFLTEILSYIISVLFPYKDAMKQIEKMIIDENALVRSQTFSNSIFDVLEHLGADAFTFDTNVINSNKRYKVLRDEKVHIEDNHYENKSTASTKDDFKLHYGPPPEGTSFENVSQENINIYSIINIHLWDNAKWKGINFINFGNGSPPILSPVFTDAIGIQIFEEWISKFNNNDVKNEIQIGIIKGINKNKPNWYRVIIGNNIPYNIQPSDQNKLITNINRIHTMEAKTLENLNRFEKELSGSSTFILAPSIMKNMSVYPDLKKEFSIQKNNNSIIICNSHDIKENDLFLSMAIMPDDNPVIPRGKENAPILDMIKQKKRFPNRPKN